MSTGLKANSDGSAAIQVGGTDVITLTSGGAATFVTSPTTVQAGTAAAPSITFSGDTNTGIYSPGADQVAIATGGSQRVTADASGRFLVGTSTAITSWGSGGAQQLQVTASGARYPGISVYAFSTTAGGDGAMINLGRSRSTTVGTMTATQSGDTLGYLIFEGVNSSNALTGGAYIQVSQSAAAGASYIPASMLFFTSDATNGATERARFNNTGAFVLAGGTTTANGIGITFPATQSASSDANTLDDYEEGTWTPAIAGGSGTTYFTQAGWYTKVGNLVTVGFDLNINAKGTISGNAQITGLPFTSGSSPSRAGGGFAVSNALGTSYVSVAGFIDNGATAIDIYIRTAAAASTSVPTGTAFFATGSQLIASFSYRV